MGINKLNLKPVVASLLFGVVSASAHALPYKSGVVYHPIHYKPGVAHLLPSGITPAQIRVAYGFNQIEAAGKGQVIAIVDAFDDPRIENDLAVFNKQFNLTPCTTKNGCFKKVYAKGRRPRTDAGWSGEIALDVEWAHAVAPQAKIILVEAGSDSLQDLFRAVQVAVKSGANVVSLSWGAPEFKGASSYDSVFRNPNVTFTASSGDDGSGVIYPASSPNVLAVGGTTLSVDSAGNYIAESAWAGSGGGVSAIETQPKYQSDLPIPGGNKMRGVPDVSYNADPNTGFAVYNSVPGDGPTGWQVVGGTSAGAPQWAAFIAVANSAVGRNVGGMLNAMLYFAANPNTGNYTQFFKDISTGANGTCGFYCSAAGGYDYVTGLGTPEVYNLVTSIFSKSV